MKQKTIQLLALTCLFSLCCLGGQTGKKCTKDCCSQSTCCSKKTVAVKETDRQLDLLPLTLFTPVI